MEYILEKVRHFSVKYEQIQISDAIRVYGDCLTLRVLGNFSGYSDLTSVDGEIYLDGVIISKSLLDLVLLDIKDTIQSES